MEVKKDEEKYLMFIIDNEHYGIPILNVNEIIGLMEITHVPRAPEYMKGIINLRGKIIPVIDFRLKFSMPERAYDELTCIIIVEIIHDGKKNFVGILVDKVAEVVNVNQQDVEMPPQYGQDSEENFLSGIGKIKGKVVMLLNIELVVNCHELISLVKDNMKKDVEKV